MIEAKTLIKIAKKAGILAERLERDYVMSLILDALSKCEKTKDDIVFKGGTCVHKCFTFFEKSDNPKEVADIIKNPNIVNMDYGFRA